MSNTKFLETGLSQKKNYLQHLQYGLRQVNSAFVSSLSGRYFQEDETSNYQSTPISDLGERLDSVKEEINYYRVIDKEVDNYSVAINSFITPRRKYSYEKAIENIISFKTLKNDWDGYGAVPSDTLCATNAILLLFKLNDSLLNLDQIYPNPHGTVMMEWRNTNNELVSLEVGSSSFSFFVELNGLGPKFYDNMDVRNDENLLKLKESIDSIELHTFV